jgi:hypothetical protein
MKFCERWAEVLVLDSSKKKYKDVFDFEKRKGMGEIGQQENTTHGGSILRISE